ncbi:hypothetical protein KP79_PYT15959 [Mizuhopecten yessoensis]|uniref:Right handed beta helix domain-containing protein n=2 Tax=Mizuhopecten yessoensis TaxID=6573 RepID=A0A210PWR7_MIZYE|nr:hypothetical protein KP79_PYT15959 [Mizuhopecten yessoensis]
MARLHVAISLIAFSLGISGFLMPDLESVHLYVSVSGSDQNSGRDVGHALKTIQAAISRLSHPDVTGKNVFIELMQGYHDLTSTVNIRHSDARKVTIRANGNSEVHVTGGKRLPTSLFKHVTDSGILRHLQNEARNKVVAARLSDAGLSHLWDLSDYGFYKDRTAPMEIFYNGAPLRMARWPNEGQGYINIASLVDGKTGSSFTFSGDRASHWSQESDLWAHGFWYWSWADRSIKVKSITASNNTITLAHPPPFGLRTGHFHYGQNYQYSYQDQGGYFRIINALSELDEPGEYYIDRTSGILYMWPPSQTEGLDQHDVIYASDLAHCFNLDHTSNVIFEGFTLEACRHYGISVRYGQNITVQRMEVRNTGSYGISCLNCLNVNITGCDVHHGDGGIKVSGGIRATLTPSRISVDNNIIHSFSRETAVGSNAISADGVGIYMAHNELHTGQYTAIRWSGNDHVMEYNHVHHLCQNATDCGALHTGRDWTGRGCVVRYNHVHHVLRLHPGADVRGVMLDDQYSSVNIYSNVFYNNDVHVNIGGGRDNIIQNNVFYEAAKSSMQVDSRGVPHSSNEQPLQKKLHAVPYTSALWAKRYPKLAVIDSNAPDEPRGNEISRNIFYNSAAPDFVGSYTNTHWFNITMNHQAAGPTDFFDPAQADFRPRCSLSKFAQSIHFPDPVPLHDVGPRGGIGPMYKGHVAGSRRDVITTKRDVPAPCTTHAPSALTPITSYLPDGSHANTVKNTPNQGCWFDVEICPNDHGFTSGLQRDVDGEKHLNTGINESACLDRVPYMVTHCGSQSKFSVIYGPTGAMTLGGFGCYFAQYGCPKHGSYHVGFIRDKWAEQHQNAAHDENACLSRALAEWRYCGSDETFPYTSIYLPTGRRKTAAGGCWIYVTKCPADPTVNIPHDLFFDAWGATNVGSDRSSTACFQRADDFWFRCGRHTDAPVTAFYRPEANSRTVP